MGKGIKYLGINVLSTLLPRNSPYYICIFILIIIFTKTPILANSTIPS